MLMTVSETRHNRDAVEMRILISALLLTIFGDKKESKCSTGDELTSSFVPAGLQVVHHYLTQIRGSSAEHEIARRVKGASDQPGAPTVIVTFNFEENPEGEDSEIADKLVKLGSALDEEASEQDLAACRGITSEVMRQLETSSRMSSTGQLSFILRRIVGGEVKKRETKDLIRKVLTELENGDSALSIGLRRVTPLKYLSDLSLE